MKDVVFLVFGILIGGGAAYGAGTQGLLPVKAPAEATPVADETPAPTSTATAVAVATVEKTPEPTQTVAATPEPTQTVAATTAATPTATKVAVAATPKPTPDPAAAEAARQKKVASLLAQGEAALNAGDFAKATKVYGQAASLDPKNGKAHLGLGSAHMIAGDNAKAKKSFQKFLDLAPDDPSAPQIRQIMGSL